MRPTNVAQSFNARSTENPLWGSARHRIAMLLAAGMPLAGCGAAEEPTPTEKLVEHFGDNFDPNSYGHFVDDAYEISEKRDPDPNSTIKCPHQEQAEMDQDEFIDYLAKCKSRQRIIEFLAARRLNQVEPNEPKPTTPEERAAKEKGLQAARAIKVDNMTMDNLFTIYALLGKDPELYTGFSKAVMTYRGWDMGWDDIFRHPITTMQSGWVDCDDSAVQEYFWAHLHHFSNQPPNLVIAVMPEETAVEVDAQHKVLNAHAFVTYRNPENGNTVALDNHNWRELQPGETAQSYLAEEYPDKNLTIEFNGPYVDKTKK